MAVRSRSGSGATQATPRSECGVLGPWFQRRRTQPQPFSFQNNQILRCEKLCFCIWFSSWAANDSFMPCAALSNLSNFILGFCKISARLWLCEAGAVLGQRRPRREASVASWGPGFSQGVHSHSLSPFRITKFCNAKSFVFALGFPRGCRKQGSALCARQALFKGPQKGRNIFSSTVI